jgi:hypothetical protein
MIDEEATFIKFGYYSTNLKFKSNKKIIRICDNCGKRKIITFSAITNLCRSCAHKGKFDTKKFEYVDEKETFKQFGYIGNKLSIGSHKSVIAKCQKCGSLRKVRFSAITNLCRLCATKNKLPMSDEHKANISKNHHNCSGRNNPMFGTKGKLSPNFGKKASLEERINMACAQQRINRKDFTGFLTDQNYCKLWTEKFRELIRNKYHNKCFLCNKSKKDNKQNLSVHHVNYDKDCLCQKTCEFIPLCIKCHSKTNHNRKMWEDIIMCYLYPERYFMID